MAPRQVRRRDPTRRADAGVRSVAIRGPRLPGSADARTARAGAGDEGRPAGRRSARFAPGFDLPGRQERNGRHPPDAAPGSSWRRRPESIARRSSSPTAPCTLSQPIYGTGIGDSVRVLAYWGLKQQANHGSDTRPGRGEHVGKPEHRHRPGSLLSRPQRRRREAWLRRQPADPGAEPTPCWSDCSGTPKNRPAAWTRSEKIIEDGWEALRGHPAVLAAPSGVGRITDVAAANRF